MLNTNYSTKLLKNQQQLPKHQQPSLFSPKEEPQLDPLQIASITNKKRLKPDWYCKLIHYESNLNVPGQFTIQEAQEILETTRSWDFTPEKDRIPRCAEDLRSLINSVVEGGDR